MDSTRYTCIVRSMRSSQRFVLNLAVATAAAHRKGANKKKNEIKTNGEWKREEKKVNTELINVYYIHI